MLSGTPPPGHPQVTRTGGCSSSSGHVGCQGEHRTLPTHQALLLQGLLPGVWLSLAEFVPGPGLRIFPRLPQAIPSAREESIKPPSREEGNGGPER